MIAGKQKLKKSFWEGHGLFHVCKPSSFVVLLLLLFRISYCYAAVTPVKLSNCCLLYTSPRVYAGRVQTSQKTEGPNNNNNILLNIIVWFVIIDPPSPLHTVAKRN